MTEQEKLTAATPSFLLSFEPAEAMSLSEWLRAANVELEAILRRIKASREESERLAAQNEEIMSKLRADWLC